MGRRTVLYRGSLKSCNYHCSYCPFSKHAPSQKENDRDRQQWFSFVRTYVEQAEERSIHALMVTPYGEALVYPWYWEGLAYVSALAVTDAAGAQTNLGFPVKEALDHFRKAGGKTEKLRLWATFHPQMTAAGEFAQSCRICMEQGVQICAGAVGVPGNLELLRQLREELPQEIYFWINKMDGLGRAYTDREIKAFSEIDPYFFRELEEHPADVSQCRDRIFTEGNGTQSFCSLSAAPGICTRKRCSCYLAYGGRENLLNQMLFGPYPLFRIPRRPKAVFLDIEGTLRQKPFCGEDTGGSRDDGIAGELKRGLEVLAYREKTALFFATTLPYEDAFRRCKSVWHLFAGGIFAGGAHVLLEGKKEYVYYLDEAEAYVGKFQQLRQRYHFRVMVYKKVGRIYKITLLRAGQRHWEWQEARRVMQCLPASAEGRVRYYIEESCMQIVAARADKASGVRMLCEWMGISPKEAFAAGDSEEDAGMIELCRE